MKWTFDVKKGEINLKISGKFYLNNGCVLSDKITFKNRKEATNFINSFKQEIQRGFKDKPNGQLTFGTTIIRFNDISAVRFYE